MKAINNNTEMKKLALNVGSAILKFKADQSANMSLLNKNMDSDFILFGQDLTLDKDASLVFDQFVHEFKGRYDYDFKSKDASLMNDFIENRSSYEKEASEICENNLSSTYSDYCLISKHIRAFMNQSFNLEGSEFVNAYLVIKQHKEFVDILNQVCDGLSACQDLVSDLLYQFLINNDCDIDLINSEVNTVKCHIAFLILDGKIPELALEGYENLTDIKKFLSIKEVFYERTVLDIILGRAGSNPDKKVKSI